MSIYTEYYDCFPLSWQPYVRENFYAWHCLTSPHLYSGWWLIPYVSPYWTFHPLTNPHPPPPWHTFIDRPQIFPFCFLSRLALSSFSSSFVPPRPPPTTNSPPPPPSFQVSIPLGFFPFSRKFKIYTNFDETFLPLPPPSILIHIPPSHPHNLNNTFLNLYSHVIFFKFLLPSSTLPLSPVPSPRMLRNCPILIR